MISNFFRSKIAVPILNQIKHGITPEKIALSIALGTTLGLFPILGASTFLCFLAGILFKLNQPTLQLVNYCVYPLQIPLILFFIRIGEKILSAKPLPYSLVQLQKFFAEDPMGFLRDFSFAGFCGIVGWALFAPFLLIALYKSLLPIIQQIRRHHS
ncbi:MAG: DUF2062 domain-containing protein [Elusimicrobia bacterium]|nr:DUF2062 domain-containing protein [Elusimicrobiota bacterium]